MCGLGAIQSSAWAPVGVSRGSTTTSRALVLRALPEQVGEGDGMRLGLVGAEEQEELGRTEVLFAGGGVESVAVGEVAEAEGPAQRVAAGVVAHRPNVGVVGTAEQAEVAADHRAGPAQQPARGLVGDGPRLAGVAQGEEPPGDGFEGFVPGDWLEFRVRRSFVSADALQRPLQAEAIVDKLRHHLRLDAEAARLHRVVRFPLNVDDAPGLEEDLEPAKRIAELASAVDHLVRLQGGGTPREVEIGGTNLGSGVDAAQPDLSLHDGQVHGADGGRASDRALEQIAA